MARAIYGFVLGVAEAGQSVGRKDVEKLVGRLSHVVAKGIAYLQPLCRLERARVTIRKGLKKGRSARGGGKGSGEKPRRLAVGAATEEARHFRVAVRWWPEVLRGGASVPLAPRLNFPEIGDEGCVFVLPMRREKKGPVLVGFCWCGMRESRVRVSRIFSSCGGRSLFCGGCRRTRGLYRRMK